MLVELSFPSKTGKTIQTKVFDVSGRRNLSAAIACLETAKVSGLHRKGATFRQIESYDGPIYVWQSDIKKFVSERKIEALAYVAMKKEQYKKSRDDNFMRKVSVFFDVSCDDFILLHKPFVTV
jgi:hypothetical protein